MLEARVASRMAELGPEGIEQSTKLITSLECVLNPASLESSLKDCNEAFLRCDYDLALKHYNTAIVMYPDEAVFFSNRSAVHYAKTDYHKALQDAEWAIERRRDWSKGYFRKGKALLALQNYEDAHSALLTALKHEPGNEEVKRAVEESARLVAASRESELVLPPPKGTLERLTWEDVKTKGKAPTACIWSSATLVGKRIFVFGGFDGRTCLDELHVLDTETMEWSQPKTQGKPPAEYYFHSANLVGKRIFIFGGIGQEALRDEDVHSQIVTLDVETLAWGVPRYCGMPPLWRLRSAPPPPSPAPTRLQPSSPALGRGRSHSATTVGSSIFLFGGWDGQGKMYGQLFIFNTDTMTWREPMTTGSPPEPRYAHSATLVGKKLYIIGGTDDPEIEEGLNVFSEIHVLDTETMAWSRVASTGEAPQNAIWHTVNVVGTKLLAFGGGPYGSKKKSIGLNILDTETMTWSVPKTYGVAPIKRFGHTTTLVGARILMFGGMGAFRGSQKIFRELHALDIAGYSLRELRGECSVPRNLLEAPLAKAGSSSTPAASSSSASSAPAPAASAASASGPAAVSASSQPGAPSPASKKKDAKGKSPSSSSSAAAPAPAAPPAPGSRPASAPSKPSQTPAAPAKPPAESEPSFEELLEQEKRRQAKQKGGASSSSAPSKTTAPASKPPAKGPPAAPAHPAAPAPTPAAPAPAKGGKGSIPAAAAPAATKARPLRVLPSPPLQPPPSLRPRLQPRPLPPLLWCRPAPLPPKPPLPPRPRPRPAPAPAPPPPRPRPAPPRPRHPSPPAPRPAPSGHAPSAPAAQAAAPGQAAGRRRGGAAAGAVAAGAAGASRSKAKKKGKRAGRTRRRARSRSPPRRRRPRRPSVAPAAPPDPPASLAGPSGAAGRAGIPPRRFVARTLASMLEDPDGEGAEGDPAEAAPGELGATPPKAPLQLSADIGAAIRAWALSKLGGQKK
eukprot:tig00020830_g14392.t1